MRQVLVGCIFGTFLIQGILVERFTKEGFRFPWASAFIEMMLFTIFSIIESRLVTVTPNAFERRNFSGQIPWLQYLIVAVSLTMARGLTWVSVSLLSFPTALLVKSSKLVAVMLGSVVFLRKRYDLLDYLVACVIIAGMVMFTLADSKSNKYNHADSTIGLLAGGVSLFADSVTSNYQERTLKVLKRPVNEMLLITNGMSTLGMLLMLATSGEISGAVIFISERSSILFEIFLAALMGYAGLNVWTATIKGFGAVVATGAGILRKFLNLLLSFLLFPKPFHLSHGVGIALFFLGLSVSWWQQKQREQAKLPAQPADETVDLESGGLSPKKELEDSSFSRSKVEIVTV